MTNSRVLMPFKTDDHPHQQCLEAALAHAAQNCAAHGVRLTPLRQRVLELIWRSHAPVKAYDILDQLRQEQIGSAPPTVYRSLDFLLGEGLIHKIQSLNAYVGCGEPLGKHSSQFLICERCGDVAEMDDGEVHQILAQKSRELGFHILDEIIEIKGLCAGCRNR